MIQSTSKGNSRSLRTTRRESSSATCSISRTYRERRISRSTCRERLGYRTVFHRCISTTPNCHVDPRGIRGSYWPSHTKEDENEADDYDNDDVELLFVYGLATATGEECSQCFADKRARYTHQRQASGGEQGMIAHLHTGVAANVCPWCHSEVSSRRVAHYHVEAAYLKERFNG